MRLIYENTDITDRVLIESAIYAERCGGGCDTLEITLSDAATWDRWHVGRGDIIRCTNEGFDTGLMYLDSFYPENGKYRLIAASMPQTATRRAWQSFEDITLKELMDAISAECGMGYAIYGLDGNTRFSYLMRKNEGGAAMLDRLLKKEGAALKCVNGKMCAIGTAWAQDRDAAKTLTIKPDTEGIEHITQDNKKLSELTVKGFGAEATAVDSAATGAERETVMIGAATDDITAGRWARGLLLNRNRKAEKLRLGIEFDGKFTAMARINIDGGSRIDGKWLVDGATHDLLNGRTNATLSRCIESVN